MAYEQKLQKKVLEYLLNQGCKVDDEGRITTADGDYVGSACLDKKHNVAIKHIFDHELTQFSSLDTAEGQRAGNTVQIGFSEKEQKWYGWTHRGYGSFGIGFIAKPGYAMCDSSRYPIAPGTKAETLEDCKIFAMAMADVLD